jgi:hypothetical protein
MLPADLQVKTIPIQSEFKHCIEPHKLLLDIQKNSRAKKAQLFLEKQNR